MVSSADLDRQRPLVGDKQGPFVGKSLPSSVACSKTTMFTQNPVWSKVSAVFVANVGNVRMYIKLNTKLRAALKRLQSRSELVRISPN